MTEAINAHKKMAMGMTEGNVMKKGGGVRKYADGGEARDIFGPTISKKDKEFLERPLKDLKDDAVQKTRSGGRITKYANGGAVSNSAASNLPAMGDKKNAGVDFNAGKAKIASLKKGGRPKGLTIAIVMPMRKSAGRGR